jgi:hypothetical protein
MKVKYTSHVHKIYSPRMFRAVLQNATRRYLIRPKPKYTPEEELNLPWKYEEERKRIDKLGKWNKKSDCIAISIFIFGGLVSAIEYYKSSSQLQQPQQEEDK